VIFISSTSVYDDQPVLVDESTPVNPITESGKQLVKAEALLQTTPILKLPWFVLAGSSAKTGIR
jgi:nucleoside-diphosphate-sugar epimerase